MLNAVEELQTLLRTHGLAELEVDRLGGLARDFRRAYSGAKPNLSYEDHQRVLQAAERIEATVRTEVKARNFGEIRPAEGMLDYSRLVDEKAKALFGDGEYYRLSAIVQKDLDEAATSLSFGAPTASVMIALRAIEGQLRELHHDMTAQVFSKPLGDLLEAMGKLLTEKGLRGQPILGYLDYLRTIRNQADHPEKSFITQEAEQLLVQSVYTVQEIEKLRAQFKNQKG